MESENWWDTEEIAGRVRGVVSDVMESLELGQLNQTVKETAGSVLEEARKQMAQCRNKVEDARWRRQTVPVSQDIPEKKVPEIRVNWKGRVSGILFTIFGSIGSAVFGIPALILLAVMTTSFQNPIGWWVTGSLGVLTLGCGIMLWKGICQNERIGRLKRYVEELKQYGKSYCEIEELSRKCVKNPGYVRRDLKKIMRLGMLPDVRMDNDEEWVILDEETYRQYRQCQEALRVRQRESQNKKRQEGGPEEKTVKPQTEKGKHATGVEAVIEQGECYMKTLDSLRETLKGDPMKEKLYRLDAVLEHLFEALKRHPEQVDDLEKFMEYYLPTTVKLVESYREFAAVEFPGENINQAKAEIRQTLDTINGAFEKLLDDLYEDATFDAMTDAAVLQNMLARDGMTETDFVRKHTS